MSVITIDGKLGSGGPELGHIIAEKLGIDYVDRLVLSEIAKEMQSTVGALVSHERNVSTISDKLIKRIETILKKSPFVGLGSDPYFGPGTETLLLQTYPEIEKNLVTSSSELNEKEFIKISNEVINRLAEAGNIVIIGRGSSAILKHRSDTLRICVTSDTSTRISRLLETGVNQTEVQQLISTTDASQERYFLHAFNCGPLDPNLYHLMLNTSEMTLNDSADLIHDVYNRLDF
jgi:cytidylate kinase